MAAIGEDSLTYVRRFTITLLHNPNGIMKLEVPVNMRESSFQVEHLSSLLIGLFFFIKLIHFF